MGKKESIREVLVAFFDWLHKNAFYNISGYLFVPESDEDFDDNEYDIDEIYDYWYENIYLNKNHLDETN